VLALVFAVVLELAVVLVLVLALVLALLLEALDAALPPVPASAPPVPADVALLMPASPPVPVAFMPPFPPAPPAPPAPPLPVPAVVAEPLVGPVGISGSSPHPQNATVTPRPNVRTQNQKGRMQAPASSVHAPEQPVDVPSAREAML
jgi:hypothetical protein